MMAGLAVRVTGIEKQLKRLSASAGRRFDGVDRRFQQVDQRFDGVDRRFDQVDQRFDGVDRRFEQVDQRFDGVDRRFEQVDQRFEAVDRRFEQVLAAIAAEGDRTRRHFDLVAEQMRAERNLVLDHGLALDARLSRHEAADAAEHTEFNRRLARLEAGRTE